MSRILSDVFDAPSSAKNPLIPYDRSFQVNPRTGYFTAGYISSIDDTEQPFALWVPHSYNPRRAYPLLVLLHGTDADHRMIPEQCFRMHERGFREDIIALSPFGRGDLFFSGPGEADLWDAMSWVKNRYRIDTRRQYLSGLSMGGYATWRLAIEYNDQWAAIAPICGGGDVASVHYLKRIPVWCVHGAEDPLVPVSESRRMVQELARLRLRHRYDELKHVGHHAWEWLYHPRRNRDSLVQWCLQFRRRRKPAPVLRPARKGQFHDLFQERLIVSYPAQTPIPREAEMLARLAEQIARYTFRDFIMRSGRFIIRKDSELTLDDLQSASHLMLGRPDNHCVLKKIERKLWARPRRGQLWVQGETYIGKSLLAATCQPSAWNPEKLLGVITYKQFQPMRHAAEYVCSPQARTRAVNIFDAQQKRFIRQES
ncbi:MAG: alpha/beta hydrolase-fold protein [Verrucomicrobiota bacterium]